MKNLYLVLTLLYLFLNCDCLAAEGDDHVELNSIGDSIYVHVSMKTIGDAPFPSNGLLINTPEGFVLIDTPWNDAQTDTLINIVKEKFGKNIILAYITHSHEDRIGGIRSLLKHNIKVLSGSLTSTYAVRDGYPAPQPVYAADTVLEFNNIFLEVSYPGEGHTSDNTIVWLPQSRVLFGGCLVKGLLARDLGNLADANPKEWLPTMEKIIDRYTDPRVVVPGHLGWGEKVLLNHTIMLLKMHNR